MQSKLYPAIDLRGGAVVRLTQGEAEAQTTYSADPVAVARGFAADGAEWLHLVNLDGAFAAGEATPNSAAIRAVLGARLGLRVQLGGGLRTLEDIEAALALGCARVILGSAAVEEPALVEAAVGRFGAEAVVVGIDAWGGVERGEVRTRGWTTRGAQTPRGLAEAMAARGVRCFIYTDIARDGMLSGPDVEGAAALGAATGCAVIASGGVGSLAHLIGVRQQGLAGVIVGKALYEGAFTLPEALAALRGAAEEA